MQRWITLIVCHATSHDRCPAKRNNAVIEVTWWRRAYYTVPQICRTADVTFPISIWGSSCGPHVEAVRSMFSEQWEIISAFFSAQHIFIPASCILLFARPLLSWLCNDRRDLSLTGFDVVPSIIEKMNEAGIKCYHPDDCPDDLNADIVLLSVPTPLIKETQRLDMKVFPNLEDLNVNVKDNTAASLFLV